MAIKHSMYKKSVRQNSILRSKNVSSISSCYFECWDIEFKCCAVGFLPSQINRNKSSNTTQVTCYMIQCIVVMTGDVLELEILVSE